MTDEFEAVDELPPQEKLVASLADKLPRGYVSISQITQFLKCGRAYYFRYVEDRVVPGNNFTVQGRGIHKAAEMLHLSIMNTPQALVSSEEMKSIYADLHDKEVSNGAVLIDEKDWGFVKDEGIRMTQAYRAGALGTLKDDSGEPMPIVRPIAAERVVKCLLTPEDSEPIPFLGVIDLEEPDTIADVKSKKKAATQGDCDNSMQLTIYAHVLGKPFVRLDQIVKPTKTLGVRYLRKSSTRTSKDAKHALNVIKDVTSCITAGIFPYTNTENWWCSQKWCAYWGDCRGK